MLSQGCDAHNGAPRMGWRIHGCRRENRSRPPIEERRTVDPAISSERTGVTLERAMPVQLRADLVAIDACPAELSFLNAAAEALNSSADVGQALERTLALVVDLLGLQTGWVWLLDPETQHFYLAAAQNLP